MVNYAGIFTFVENKSKWNAPFFLSECPNVPRFPSNLLHTHPAHTVLLDKRSCSLRRVHQNPETKHGSRSWQRWEGGGAMDDRRQQEADGLRRRSTPCILLSRGDDEPSHLRHGFFAIQPNNVYMCERQRRTVTQQLRVFTVP